MRKMSTHSIATLPRLSSTTLSQIILQNTSSNLNAATPPPGIAIIDVRDDDHIGGHIKHSMHIPSSTLDHQIPSLVRKLKDKETVVFHCALSQQRGPSAALRYLRERERLLGPGGKAGGGNSSDKGVGGVLRKNKGEGAREKGGADKEEKDGEGEWEDIENEEKKKEQKVYVLDRGFVGWQERFGQDTRLTEGYRKEIWENGY